jgi:hypothetical protein
MTKHTPATPTYIPRLGYRGWVCKRCFAIAERDRHIPGAFMCYRPTCDSQYAEYTEVE